MFLFGMSIPIYTDPDAPARLSQSLSSLPREDRFNRWYQELSEYETAHKRIVDCGRGLIALGLGISLSAGFLLVVSKSSATQVGNWVTLFWVLIWVIQIPFSFWYYEVRQARFDYPNWGDSIAIGVCQNGMTCLVGLVLSAVALICGFTRIYSMLIRQMQGSVCLLC